MVTHELVGPEEVFDTRTQETRCKSSRFPSLLVTIGTSDEQLENGIYEPCIFSVEVSLNDEAKTHLLSFPAEVMFCRDMMEKEVFTLLDSYSEDWGLVAKHIFGKKNMKTGRGGFVTGNVLLFNCTEYDVSPILFEPDFDMEALVRDIVSMCNVVFSDEEDSDINYFVFLGNTKDCPIDKRWKEKFSKPPFTVINGKYPNTFYAVLRVVSCGYY